MNEMNKIDKINEINETNKIGIRNCPRDDKPLWNAHIS